MHKARGSVGFPRFFIFAVLNPMRGLNARFFLRHAAESFRTFVRFYSPVFAVDDTLFGREYAREKEKIKFLLIFLSIFSYTLLKSFQLL